MTQKLHRLPTDRLPTHPGEMLLEEFLKPLGITQVAFAKHLEIPLQRLNELIKGKRGITPDTAWLLSMALGTSPEIWLDLQAQFDLREAPTGTESETASALPHQEDRVGREQYGPGISKLLREKERRRHTGNRAGVGFVGD